MYPTQRQLTALTFYEEECLAGRGIKGVADRMKISPKTVEFHLSRLRQRLGVKMLQGLISWGVRSGLLYGLLFLLSTAQAQSAGSFTASWTLSTSPGIASQTLSRPG